MPIVLLHCHQHTDWIVQFLEADLRTPVCADRYYFFRTLQPVERMLARGNASISAVLDFQRDIRRWGIGTAWLTISDKQYQKLKTKC